MGYSMKKEQLNDAGKGGWHASCHSER